MQEMQTDKNEQLVIAYFPSQADAENAVEAIKDWDAANPAVKLGGVGIMAKENGKVKTSHVGRKTGKGAAVGAAVGILGGLLTGGIGLIVAAVGGSALGGAAGALFKQSLAIGEDDLKAIDAELESGKVAVVVACDAYEVEGVVADLRQHGAATVNFSMAADALPATAEAADQAVEDYRRSQEGTANIVGAALDSTMNQSASSIDTSSAAASQLRGKASV
ncbi:MAG: hypothetical protein KAX65_08860 [Caldilineaceae bacterium]|nr:hypothetical protein [Caldilineaceae bacterium]